MRIDVKKFLFLGLREDLSKFFKNAQREGIIHFIDSNPNSFRHVPAEIDRVVSAIKVVRSLPVSEQEEGVDFDRSNEIVDCILRLKDTIERNQEQVRLLRLEVARIEVFGDFSKEDIQYIEQHGRRKVQFYAAASGKIDDVEDRDNLIFVGSEYGLDYFAGINQTSRQYPGLAEIKIEKPLGDILEALHEAEETQDRAEERLKTYARFNTYLHEALNVKLNHTNLETTKTYVQKPLDGNLFAVEGWVPINKVANLNTLLLNNSIHSEEISIEPHDVIPTYLQNEGACRIGEDLINIYDTPSHTDKDPSMWVLGFFALFFAMIVGDGGYGLVFLAIALYINYKYPNLKGAGKRVLKLVYILSAACIIWGLLNTAFFGIAFSVDNPLRKVSLVTWLAEKKAIYELHTNSETLHQWIEEYKGLNQAQSGSQILRLGATINEQGIPNYKLLAELSDQVFIEIVLLVAVVHVGLSMLRYIRRNWSGIGWIMFLTGCWLYIPWTFLDAVTFVQYLFYIPPEKAVPIGLSLIYAGVPLAIILAVIQHKLPGLAEIMHPVQIFADVMSYLRLYALGLAGAIVASMLNELANAVPFLFAVVLIILGHTINMVMAVASGIIHGLRLNFLEWYHYSFEGGGRPFRPLKLLDVPSANKQNQITE